MIPWTHYNMNMENTSDKSEIYFYEQKPLYEEKGVLFILPGWSYIADTWSPVLLTNQYLIKYYRVFIILNRGYNNKYYDYGNTLKQYATDVYEFIKNRNLTNISLLGHSIGAAIVWNIIHLYGETKFKNFIIVDEPPVLFKNAIATHQIPGAVYDNKELHKITNIFHGSNKKANKYKTGFINKLFTTTFNKNHSDVIKKVSDGTIQFNNKVLGDILIDTIHDLNMEKMFKNNKIDKPTLIIGGKDSVVPFDSIIYQKKYYTHPKVFIFKEGASHSMIIENYTLFNIVLNKFLKTSMKKSPKSLKRKFVVSKNRTYKNRTPK